MSLHKLTAGSGYDYLTRQVARQDATETGHTGLASYYSAKGEAPGVWVGSGMTGITGLAAGDVVTSEQMGRLFGVGLHPVGDQLAAQLDGTNATAADYQKVERLGQPYPVYSPREDVSGFRIEVARAFEAHNRAQGLPAHHAIPLVERAAIRSGIARTYFVAEHGREPVDDRELGATVAKHSRPKTTAVAGYDLTFSPVKSVSTLWAVADLGTAARIEAAHQAAVKDALAFIETRALFTRTGKAGVQQVDVQGLVGAAFTHRDSRAGDPDLHTHVAVANKVQTLDGRWLSIDGRVLFKANVTASETYNTALETHLRTLGLTFTERPNPDPRKRPVREVIGVDPRLNARWSTRRVSIEVRRNDLAQDFQAAHGRPPSPVEAIQLAQQATIETRDPKHEPRSLTEQRATWKAQAVQALGSEKALQKMVRAAFTPGSQDPVDDHWWATLPDAVLEAVQSRRATWQTWHVRAEAHRRLRGAGLPADRVEVEVDRLVNQVLTGKSVPVTTATDDLIEPNLLRRADGASVYTVTGAELFTSTAVLDAEARLVAAAGRHDGRRIPEHVVAVALLESTANGTVLNPGQAALVTAMATSGARVQLGIAPAGSGKTTAMAALTTAWTSSGGTVIGLAPSAAAAAQLREQTGARTDTLAKLTHSLSHDPDNPLLAKIGPKSLVIIDEAGMADTLSLDTAVTFITQRGGSVRLIGDDQQLAAVGAGGVLRDIATTHGAVHLSELLRFTDPAEAAATLALRDGKPEALGFYLDRGRVHVGDLATITEHLFTAWATDRTNGKDALMLAPTRDMTRGLNERARAHRLQGQPEPARTVTLGDGSVASVGDVVITRVNRRDLRTTRTDFVKNGDRWTIKAAHPGGDLTVTHHQNRRTIRLPADYAAAHVDLGYATTIHTAQGVTADTTHGLLTGQENRQHLYTMSTRGRHGNHLYLQVVGDGDPHTLIRPETVLPETPSELLETILARDDSPRSATTQHAEHQSAVVRLGQATARYVDALHTASLARLGREALAELDDTAEDAHPGLCDAPAWPTLRSHLALHAATGLDPAQALRHAVTIRELDTAVDPAAVLDWRLDDTGLRGAGPGPLPWTPAIPPALAADPDWGDYLTRRAHLVRGLAGRVADQATTGPTPAWATQGTTRPPDYLLGRVAVWRAARGIPDSDVRPTGPPCPDKAPALYQRKLNDYLGGDRSPALAEWAQTLRDISPATRTDTFAPILAQRLAAISRTGINARALLAQAAARGPLPDEHAAAALWWRIAPHLSPAVTAQVDHQHILTADWAPALTDALGTGRAQAIQDSPWWAPLVTTIEHALQRGWRLEQLLDTAPAPGADLDVDNAQAMVWRITGLLDPPPPEHDQAPPEERDEPPVDLFRGYDDPALDTAPTEAEWDAHPPIRQPADPAPFAVSALSPREVDAGLRLAALVHASAGPLEPSDAQVEHQVARAGEWQHAPVARDRMVQVNHWALAYYEAQLARGGWAREYLIDRFCQDVTGHADVRPGHAPAGWTHLVDHLRTVGVSDTELVETGLASTTRTGRLIDRFRDRTVFPIVHHGEVLGFVGRRNPDHSDDTPYAGPKYLNTPTTALFAKGDQLYGVIPELLDAGATPVLVEGPIDAHAVTLATRGTHVGVAPLGTTLTEAQAAQLAGYGITPVVATDADLPGRIAAERAYWLLAQHGVRPLMAILPDGSDPGDILSGRGPKAVAAAINNTEPLAEVLLHERLTNLTGPAALTGATSVAATGDPHDWDDTARTIAQMLNVPEPDARQAVLEAVQAWHADPRTIVVSQLGQASAVTARLHTAEEGKQHQRLTRARAVRLHPTPSMSPTPATWPTRTTSHPAGPLR